MTIMRDGVTIAARASGTQIDGDVATSDSPMIVASVSKIVTAYMISHLHRDGLIDLAGPMPWALLGIAPHPDWNSVTVRDLLDHTSGMPVARQSWFNGGGDCASYLPSLVASPPQQFRGSWRYSNGNYCALGRLVEALTFERIDVAAQRLIFDPLGVGGIHLTIEGLAPGDIGHNYDVSRLSRLGAAGTFVVSTDDLASMLSATGPDDYQTLAAPGIFTDQYGWGHTGTVDGAKACVWVMESGRTVVAATIAGDSPATGGGVCDRVVPALAVDLGFGTGERPNRAPP